MKAQREKIGKSIADNIRAERSQMLGSTMYLSGREIDMGEYIQNSNSCSMCERMIINAGIAKVIVRDTDTKYRVIDVNDWIINDESIQGEFGY